VDSTRQRAELEQAIAEAELDIPRRGRPSLSPDEPSTDVHLTVTESLYDLVYERASQERCSVPEVLRRLLVIEFRNPK
jgi:hypothetical protein